MSGPTGAPGTEVVTREGPALVRVVRPATVNGPGPGHLGTLLLGHGAGGRRDAADLLALAALAEDGWTVVLVDQPWRVAGRRVATAPPSLDRAWTDVTTTLMTPGWQQEHDIPLPVPWVVGGRSAGARVACRTAPETASVAGVVCLAFPLHPPGRPDRSRAAELARPLAAALPTLVVQGTRDPFGTPEEVSAAVGPDPALTLVPVPGAHSPSRELTTVRRQVADFLAALP
ncbi:alpha/beta hydrolase family protein [Ornithinimicrobium avium]|uniref:KANL3/Tex30 alpha/beta hydrolase-like domain-containing protein n=1 Tax=Ornithinimicrobium avium TaxID=2283195 RepID=A0A345NRL2_9MICO|nr:alpha/beta family hydrolase [Ornithinimicrobium avium]AXH97670.1 hypothetical protein DV701_17535 [Ornithinimicrobium avium]